MGEIVRLRAKVTTRNRQPGSIRALPGGSAAAPHDIRFTPDGTRLVVSEGGTNMIDIFELNNAHVGLAVLYESGAPVGCPTASLAFRREVIPIGWIGGEFYNANDQSTWGHGADVDVGGRVVGNRNQLEGAIFIQERSKSSHDDSRIADAQESAGSLNGRVVKGGPSPVRVDEAVLRVLGVEVGPDDRSIVVDAVREGSD